MIPSLRTRKRLKYDYVSICDKCCGTCGMYPMVATSYHSSVASHLHGNENKHIYTHVPIVLPRAAGMDDIELGGITPTSVTTAVIYDGGVRS